MASDDIWDELDEMEAAVPWVPENPGDSISGLVSYVEDSQSEYGPFKRLTLDTRSGPRTVAGFGAVLKRSFEAVSEGDAIKLVYQGKRKTKDGKAEYKDFLVAHRTAEELARASASRRAAVSRPVADWPNPEASF